MEDLMFGEFPHIIPHKIGIPRYRAELCTFFIRGQLRCILPDIITSRGETAPGDIPFDTFFSHIIILR
jgi:hypothetical protein